MKKTFRSKWSWNVKLQSFIHKGHIWSNSTYCTILFRDLHFLTLYYKFQLKTTIMFNLNSWMKNCIWKSFGEQIPSFSKVLHWTSLNEEIHTLVAEFFAVLFSNRLSNHKVHIFWEGHNILRNLHLTFVYLYCTQK